MRSNPDIVAALLAGGTPPNARPHGLPPALFAAISDGACVLELLEAGADPNAVDDEGQTPLHYAAAANEHTVIRILLTYDANLDARDNAGRTPIDLAPTDFVRRLLRPMPDPARPLPNGSVVTANNGD
ncbi:hypothetical protein R5R35_001842 [Gryllus longicercus]|uniref:Ankyrin repeat domain-containing protein n=1 Tax=Gryllus longicercus TaxID=2509291 RepID=A0AAN9Z281_9ORTH